MSIRLHISVCRKESPAGSFSSFGAECGLELELDGSLLADPTALLAKAQEHYGFCEIAMNDQLQRLRIQAANGTRPTAASPAADTGPRPQATPRPRSRSVVPPPPRPAAEPVAEEYGDAFEPDQDQEDDPPTDGNHLLGWARNQPGDAKGWLVGLGKRMRYPNRILDWTPKQVQTAYQTYRQAQRG